MEALVSNMLIWEGSLKTIQNYSYKLWKQLFHEYIKFSSWKQNKISSGQFILQFLQYSSFNYDLPHDEISKTCRKQFITKRSQNKHINASHTPLLRHLLPASFPKRWKIIKIIRLQFNFLGLPSHTEHW